MYYIILIINKFTYYIGINPIEIHGLINNAVSFTNLVELKLSYEKLPTRIKDKEPKIAMRTSAGKWIFISLD